MTNEEKVLKLKCEGSLLFYARYIYKENHNRKFILSNHFEKIAEYLEAVYRGEISRLIINMPPRYGKTELAIKIFVSWCIAKNNASKFLHLSYSDALALDNSSQTKEYIQSEPYQRLWKMTLKKDAQSKGKWFNEFGGGMYATSSGGAITGFGAGVTGCETFSGAILIDDPLKPDDAFSEVKRGAINDRYNNTIRSRTNDLAVEGAPFKTPIIVIMQRLHEDDMSGFLLDGGSGEEWTHLCMPVLDENNKPLWNDKHNFKQIEQIRQADRYTFSGQYMQTPSPDEGGEWKRDWFPIIDQSEVPRDVKWNLYIDGAYTKETKNDPTGFQVSGRSGNNLYILSSIDKYLEMPQLIRFVQSYIDALNVKIHITKVEPKASGKSLVQLIRSQTRLNVTEIRGSFVNTSKIEMARASSSYIESQRVILVKGAWNEAFLHQIALFPNGKHDEHIDLTCYSVEENLLRWSPPAHIM
jgi:predicted phage terminase large subunit-like protein